MSDKVKPHGPTLPVPPALAEAAPSDIGLSRAKPRTVPQSGTGSRANIDELFSSYQGEGIYVGVRQIFIRFSGCHLRCVYCDSPHTWQPVSTCKIQIEPFTAKFDSCPNPVTVDFLLDTVSNLKKHNDYHSVSLTGGEPLVQTQALLSLLRGLKKIGFTTYLETSGTLSDKLEVVADLVDIFAFDIKLPSCPGVKIDWKDTSRCIEFAKYKDVFVKIVVMKDSSPEEIKKACSVVSQVSQKIPLVLMPVTPINEEIIQPDDDQLSSLKKMCELEGVKDVRIVPQNHKMMNWH